VTWRVHETEVMPLIEKYMPRRGTILDAGCGRGGMLIHLHRMGYPIKGCELSQKNIQLIKDYAPDVEVDFQDILHFSYQDATFDAMLSYGVIEHFEDGPSRALREAHRVLKHEGLLFVSVPYRNPFTDFVRNMKANPFLRTLFRKGSVIPSDEKPKHVELLFSRAEFSGHLTRCGFKVLESIPLRCKHTVAWLSPTFRAREYPSKLTYGVILNPALSNWGKVAYFLISSINHWMIGNFQFFVAQKT